MKPVYQTILKPPLGNCLQACIASLLEVGLGEVPNFMAAPDSDWFDDYQTWMVSHHGVQPLCLDLEQLGDRWYPAGYYLLQGKSPRGEYDHVVVARDGEIVHDPHPDGGGLRTREIIDVFVSTMERDNE